MLAILCYICSPTSSNDLCQSVSNVSECGDKVEGTSTTARLCANISIETLFGGQTTNLNIMKCESKVWLWWSFFFVVHSATILVFRWHTGADLGGGCRGCDPPPPEMTCGFLIQLVFCQKKKKTMWFIGVEVEQETSAPPPKKIPDRPWRNYLWSFFFQRIYISCLS